MDFTGPGGQRIFIELLELGDQTYPGLRCQFYWRIENPG
jgi:hypothetical protein